MEAIGNSPRVNRLKQLGLKKAKKIVYSITKPSPPSPGLMPEYLG